MAQLYPITDGIRIVHVPYETAMRVLASDLWRLATGEEIAAANTAIRKSRRANLKRSSRAASLPVIPKIFKE